jgi:hypothetical protein
MKRFGIVIASLALMGFASSCEKEKTPDPAPAAPSAAVAPTPPPPAPQAAAPAAETIPVAADFEEEAEKAITPANYKKELATIEAEIK